MEDKKLYQIFVSSTFSDLRNEREEVVECIIGFGHLPIGMERFPAANENPLDHIYKMIDFSDYYVLILGMRYGSYNNNLKMSYTEAEYEYAFSLEKPILVFCLENYQKKEVFLEQSDIDRKRLHEFYNKVKGRHLTKDWNDCSSLFKAVTCSLNHGFSNNPQVGWVRADKVKALDTQAKEIQSLQAKLISKTEYSSQLEEKLNNLTPSGNLDYMNKEVKFTISLEQTEKHYGSETPLKKNATLELRWLVLFKLLAEELLGQTRNQETLFGYDMYSNISHYHQECRKYVGLVFTQADINHIKTKFYASGLIGLQQLSTQGAGLGLFWSLTDAGRNYLALIANEPVLVALSFPTPSLVLGDALNRLNSIAS